MVNSSLNLHPKTGARYVFERDGQRESYSIEVYAAGGARFSGVLRWTDDGAAVLEPTPSEPGVQTELLKLARVVKRTRQARLTRWRD